MTGIVSADPSCQPSPFDAIRRTRDDGTEYWLGRELQAVVEYSRWEDFAKLIERARVSAANTGADVDRAFSVITEKGAGRASLYSPRVTSLANPLANSGDSPSAAEYSRCELVAALACARLTNIPENFPFGATPPQVQFFAPLVDG